MPVPYNKVRISGTMPGGEVWSVNPCFGRADGTAISDFELLEDWAQQVAGSNGGAVAGTRMRELMSDTVRITQVRTEYYGPDGKLGDVAEANVGQYGVGSGTATKPYQACVALSLRTARPGRSYRGRLYWPAQGASIGALSLRLTPSNAQAIALEAAGWLRGLAAVNGQPIPLQPIVVSHTRGINTPITRVEVGDILDVQRRRRDAIEETYVSSPLTPA